MSEKWLFARRKYSQSEKGRITKRRWNATDKARATRRAWYHRKIQDPEFKETQREYHRKWERSPSGKKYRHEYAQRIEVKERMKVYRRKWEEGNGYQKKLLKNRIHWQRRRAAGKLTREQWEQVLDEWNHKCAYCGTASDNLTIDHIIPIAKGGTNDPKNLAPACRSCNSRKRDQLIQPTRFG